jgi:hypothetical protein
VSVVVHLTPEPREGDLRAVNYIVGECENGHPLFNHHLEQYRDGAWSPIPVFLRNANGTLTPIPRDV